jgi:hypothetical protein
MNWLDTLTNEERRRHKKAYDPDLPHPYRARHVTNKNDPAITSTDKRWAMVGGVWTRIVDLPCAICGGSKSDVLRHPE